MDELYFASILAGLNSFSLFSIIVYTICFQNHERYSIKSDSEKGDTKWETINQIVSLVLK